MRGRPRTTTRWRSSGGGGRSTRLRETKRGRFNNPQSRPADQKRREYIRPAETGCCDCDQDQGRMHQPEEERDAVQVLEGISPAVAAEGRPKKGFGISPGDDE